MVSDLLAYVSTEKNTFHCARKSSKEKWICNVLRPPGKPVEKEEYLSWESEVVKAFYNPAKVRTELVPVDGTVAVLSKEKFILVADATTGDDSTASAQVMQGATGLVAKAKVKMWHVANHALEGVNYGVSDDLFVHPACDVGGLTNLRQKVGEPASFVDGPAGGIKWPTTSANAETLATMLHAWWCKLARKDLGDAFKEHLQRWLESVTTALPSGCTLRFHALPPEHRVLVTPADVKARTGRYYVRVFGGDSFAKTSDGEGLFCGVTEKFVTPNINMFNLNNEYVQYHDQEQTQAFA